MESLKVGDAELTANTWYTAVNDSKHGTYGTNYVSFSAKSCVPIGQTSMVYIGVPPNLSKYHFRAVLTNSNVKSFGLIFSKEQG